jgi:sterol desaturase/sphingolipid hydroxylase (fatty acid hydroxylase superfamily)
MGAMFVSNKDETVRMFKNPVLEYFSHIHPATPVVVFIPVVTFCMVLAYGASEWWLVTGIFLLGALFWTLTEYTLHRWVFHYEPKTALGKKMHFMIHGVHHDYPRDSTRLVMPLLVSVPLAIAFFYLFKVIIGAHHLEFFAGFVFGYVAYDVTHFATHHWPMKNRVARFLKEYHMKHHYVDPDTAYSITIPIWDVLFGTLPGWARQKFFKNKTKPAGQG